MTGDDREQFAEEQRRYAAEIAADAELQRSALDTTAQADRHGYSYVWRWLGLPIIQMPTDVVALQEVIWDTRPQLIIETGVARGGSVVFFASILQLLGEGSVVGVDIDIRAHNRAAIEAHPLAHRVRLIEGSSLDGETVETVRRLAAGLERVMVVLDSNHTHEHVLGELHAYSQMVTPGQFLVVADTMVELLPEQTYRPRPWGLGNNAGTALEAFLKESDEFEQDAFLNGKLLMTSSPGGYLRRAIR